MKRTLSSGSRTAKIHKMCSHIRGRGKGGIRGGEMGGQEGEGRTGAGREEGGESEGGGEE